MIEVKNLSVQYAHRDRKAVQGVSFHVREGEFFSIVGPSGCGKTTTLRSVAGLETPCEGEIMIADKLVFSALRKYNIPPNKRGIGMVFQSYAIWPHMNVFDNVAFPLSVHRKISRHELVQRVERVLELVGLKDWIRSESTQLSGGQQQRLALARALISQPKVLLLDEPLSNLDAKLRTQMRLEIRELQRRLGMTTLYVTHDQEEALSMSDRIAVMKDGKIIQEGSPEDLYYRPVNEFVATFIGNTNILHGQWRSNQFRVDGTDFTCKSNQSVPDGPGNIMIRPEDISMVSETTYPDNVFVGKVISTMFLGQFCECKVELNQNCLLRVRLHHSYRPREGQIVKFGFPAESCIPLQTNMD